MTADYYPLQVLLLTILGWVNRDQQRTIEYLVEESRVLKGDKGFKGSLHGGVGLGRDRS